MEVAKGSRLPSVASLWWTNENVKKPGDQCAPNSKDQNGVENTLEPLDDGAGPQKEENDGCFDQRQYWEVEKVERHVYLVLLAQCIR